MDKSGQPITGLEKSAFSVYEDNRLREIVSVSEDDAPYSIGILVDQSASMGSKKLIHIPEDVEAFIHASNSADEFSLIGFNSHPNLLAEKAEATANLIDKLRCSQLTGGTAIYDALQFGIKTLQQSKYPAHVLVLITDGQENSSLLKRKDIMDMLSESQTVLYSICVMDVVGHDSRARLYGQDLLNKLTKITGGKAFYPKNENQMLEDFNKVAVLIRKQYSLAYRATDSAMIGAWHKIEVKLVPSMVTEHLSVRYPTRYPAQAPTRALNSN